MESDCFCSIVPKNPKEGKEKGTRGSTSCTDPKGALKERQERSRARMKD